LSQNYGFQPVIVELGNKTFGIVISYPLKGSYSMDMNMIVKSKIRHKLVAIDVDDTLLTSELKIPERTKDVIQEAVKLGVKFTLATGRMFKSVLPYARALNIDVPLICYNGALLKDPITSATLFHKGVPRNLAKSIMQFCRENGFSLNVYIDDDLYVENINKHVDYYMDVFGVQAHPVNLLDILNGLSPAQTVTKLLIITEEELSEKWAPVLAERYKGFLYVTRSKSRFIEFLNAEVNKGACLKLLAEEFGINRSEVMAIGDSYNDIEMFTYAGFSIALGKVPDAVRRAASVVIESELEMALAEALKRFLFRDTVA
jgi:Cof subfamily protein (haloacid dehalogenase superfamily)